MKKLNFIFFIFLLFFFLIIVKLFVLQVLKPIKNFPEYLKTYKLKPQRGKIYDQNGDILATNEFTYQLIIDPKKITKENLKEQYFGFLEKNLGIDRASLEAKFNPQSQWLPVKKVGWEQKKSLEKNSFFYFYFEENQERFYPESSLSAYLTGFVGKNDKGESVGYFGIEGYYNKELTGIPGIIKTERNISNLPIIIGNQELLPPKNGRDIYLTINKGVQKIIKKKLQTSLEKYKAKAGCIIVANPDGMEILGLVCLPDYNPNEYYQYNNEAFKNPAVSQLYEPGSIFKPLIVAAALETKKIKPNDTVDEDKPYQIGQYQIKTWNNQYEGKITITRVLEKSSNVGMIKIGNKLGERNLYQYLKKYGFDELTGIDLQEETSGSIKPINQWHPIDFATVTFGQGIAVTPIQMMTAFASIINGGYLYQPRVVKEIVDGKKRHLIKNHLKRKILSEKTSEIIKKMLYSTVENAEVDWQKIKPPGYQIGGKTGTAQVPIAGHYDPNKTVASFIGFFPISQPKYLILVILKEPSTSIWGSETAAPTFFEVVKELIVYYNIPPDKPN